MCSTRRIAVTLEHRDAILVTKDLRDHKKAEGRTASLRESDLDLLIDPTPETALFAIGAIRGEWR